MRVGVVRDPRYLDHEMEPGHVESPRRLQVIYEMLDGESSLPIVNIEPRPASREEIGRVHDSRYIDLLESTSRQDWFVFDSDTAARAKTWETSLLAAGGLLRGADLITSGEIPSVLALVRPPGHHAEADRAMGFCFINNIAVAAEHLIRARGLKRILIADWDVHHGNGTERTFYERNDVLYFSTHQVPLYPGTGAIRFSGFGRGEGYNLNVPLLRGKGDEDFLYVYENLLVPVARQYRPDFILVSAGFDIAAGDPLGGMMVSQKGFRRLAALLRRTAEETCGGHLAIVLEGGYNFEALKNGVKEVLTALSTDSPEASPPAEPSAETRIEVEPCFRAFRKYWDIPSPGESG